jgi:hypothetical protein
MDDKPISSIVGSFLIHGDEPLEDRMDDGQLFPSFLYSWKCNIENGWMDEWMILSHSFIHEIETYMMDAWIDWWIDDTFLSLSLSSRIQVDNEPYEWVG